MAPRTRYGFSGTGSTRSKPHYSHGSGFGFGSGSGSGSGSYSADAYRGGSRGRRRDGRGGGRWRNSPEGIPSDVFDQFDDLGIVEEGIVNSSSENVINFDANYEDLPVEVTGQDVPLPVTSFDEIDLGESIKENIKRCKYVKPTPIQCRAIPVAVAGRDLMACAQTGSGKTAAFCFPIISGILRECGKSLRGGSRMACPVALVLAPTRELSCQIHEEAKKFAYQTGVKVVVAYGGAPISQQLHKMEGGIDILVATPGRLVDMIERGRISLSMIKYLALDEADRMLDMGFEPQVRKIVQQMDMPPPGQRQTLLFSATFPSEIQRLASDFLSNYIFLTVGRVGSSTNLISQRVEYVEDMDKRKHLFYLLRSQRSTGNYGKHALTLVFVETKRAADSLERWLCRDGFPAVAIHGDKVQFERERALRSFKTGATPVMVATDVAARGLDIPSVAHVINFELPRNIDNYVHRIGRTGRAGKSGLATAFFSSKNMPLAKALAELMEESNQDIPTWLTDYAKQSCYDGGYRSHQARGDRFGGRDFRSFPQPNDTNDNYSIPDAVDDPSPATYDSSDVASAVAVDPSVVASYASIIPTGWD